MPQGIKIVKAGVANCYLLGADRGYVLIDTGSSRKRSVLREELAGAGCSPGDLRLVILTHGDSDHSGNAAYLRGAYGAKIAAHPREYAVLESGDMRQSRDARNRLARRVLLRTVLPFFRLRKADRLTPDLYLADGDDLSDYGLEAVVLHLPGHSRGSIGVLTASGDLFCGDLLASRDNKPGHHFAADNAADFAASIRKLRGLEIKTVYPGHGGGFPGEGILQIRV